MVYRISVFHSARKQGFNLGSTICSNTDGLHQTDVQYTAWKESSLNTGITIPKSSDTKRYKGVCNPVFNLLKASIPVISLYFGSE